MKAVAGTPIAFRFTSTDAFGQPVTAIPAGVPEAVSAGTCAGTPTTLAPTDSVKGKGSLSNLGNGAYELRWKGSRADRGQRRLVTITLADGVPHTATIQFAP